MKLLIADDSVEIRMLLYATAEYSGFEPLLADDGEEAMRLIDENDDIALVLTDVYMPVVDGITLARHVRTRQRGVHIPVVFMTDVNADERLAEFLETGDDFIIKPFSQTVILAKLAAHRRLVEIHRRLAQQNHVLTQFQKTTEAEHFVASDVINRSMQGGLSSLPGIRFFSSPMTDFNGDSVVLARNRSGSAYFMVVDVSGHGLPAALGTIPLIEAFLAGVWNASGVGQLAAQLNRVFLDKMPDYLLAALLLGEIAPDGQRLQLWNGGMPPVMVLDADGHVQDTLHSAHMPLGAHKPHEFNENAILIMLDRGQQLLCFSDGLSEARNARGAMFGLDGIREALARGAAAIDPVTTLNTALGLFREGHPVTDDVTLLAYRPMGPLPTLPRREAPPAPAIFLPFEARFRLQGSQLTDPQTLPGILAVFKAHPTIAPRFNPLAVVLSELFSNALDHGLLGLDSGLKDHPDGLLAYHEKRLSLLEHLDPTASIEIEALTRQGEHAPLLDITLRDSGPGFDYHHHQGDEGFEHMHGRGVGIVSHLVEHLGYLGTGNTVKFTMKLAPTP